VKLAAVLIAVAAWLLVASATAHAAPTTITFDDPSLNGRGLGGQFAAQGVTFNSRQCESGAWIVARSTAHSPGQNAELICGSGEIRPPALGVDAGFARPQTYVAVWVRTPVPQTTQPRGVATLSVYGQGDPPVPAVATTNIDDGQWHRLVASLPGEQISAFRLSSTSNAGLEFDDLEFASDETPPQIDIYAPVDGAVYALDEPIRAEYYCYDEVGGSGIAAQDGCKGTFAYNAPVDTSTLGEHEFVVEARDNAGNTSSKTVKYKVVETRISVTPSCDVSGMEGNHKIRVSGFGVDPNRRGILMLSGGSQDAWQHPIDIVAAADGTFTVDIEPPRRLEDGFYDITFHYRVHYGDGYYEAGPVIASAVFALPCPTLEVEPKCGPAATGSPDFYTLSVAGRGYPPGKPVVIAFAGERVGETLADVGGGFKTTITTPLRPTGTYELTAIGSTRSDLVEIISYVPPPPPPGANFDVEAKTTFKVPCDAPPPSTPSISVDATCGAAGPTQIRVTGAGFVADRSVNLLFDGKPAGTGRVTANGTLDATLAVADASPRLHTVSVRYDSGDADLATAYYVVPCAPEVSVTPDCGQARMPDGSVGPYTVEVNGRGFVPPGTASLSVNGSVVRPDVAVAEDGTLSAAIEVDPLPTGRYEVRVEQQVSVGNGQTKPYVAVAAFSVPCGEVTVTPGCDVPLSARRGGELYRLSVRGKSFAPGSSVGLTFEDTSGASVAAHAAKASDDGSFSTTFNVPRQRQGTYLIRAMILRGGVSTTSFLTSALTVPCRPPTIKVDPPLGRPGFLTTVKGRDFPPKARIRLSWNTGSLGSTHVRTDGNGRFDTRMLVFLHDLLGPRLLTARTETGYSKATADYLVVPGSQQPSGFLMRR
jgi:hypothetical protein